MFIATTPGAKMPLAHFDSTMWSKEDQFSADICCQKPAGK